MKRINLIGKKFGRLLVISYSHSHAQPSKQKRAMWNVVCDCGNNKIVSSSSLSSGGTISCGCYFKEIISAGCNKKLPGEANFNYKYISYKNRAKNHRKKLEFNLSKDQFRLIIDKNCFYCGKEPYMAYTHRSPNGEYISNGIDRVDSSIGYNINNCVPCCHLCNMMKNDMSYNEFINHVKRINDHAIKTR